MKTHTTASKNQDVVRRPSDHAENGVSSRSENHGNFEPDILPQNDNDVNRLPPHPDDSLLALALDIPNLTSGAQRNGGRPHYRRIISELTEGRPFIGTACLAVRYLTSGIGRFMRMLDHVGLGVAVWQPASAAHAEKSADDVLLAVEAMKLLYRSDVTELVLVTGDSDLRPVLRAARGLGKRVTVASFSWNIASALRAQADAFVSLTGAHVIVDTTAR